MLVLDWDNVPVFLGDNVIDCERDDVPDEDGVAERLSVDADEPLCVIVGVKVKSVLAVTVGVSDAELVGLGDDEGEGDADCDCVAHWLGVTDTLAVGAWLLLDDALPVPETEGDAVSLGDCDVLAVDDWLSVSDDVDVAEVEAVGLVDAVKDADDDALAVAEGLGVADELGVPLPL